jgi:hypothetical protein
VEREVRARGYDFTRNLGNKVSRVVLDEQTRKVVFRSTDRVAALNSYLRLCREYVALGTYRGGGVCLVTENAQDLGTSAGPGAVCGDPPPMNWSNMLKIVPNEMPDFGSVHVRSSLS